MSGNVSSVGQGAESGPGDGDGGERVRVERFVAGGRTLGRRPDGRIVLVRGGLPGEQVIVTITGRRGGAELADAIGWTGVSTDRVTPPCPRRIEGCGGCDWQHLATGAQLPAKVDVVADALRRTGRLPDAVVVPGASVPAEGERTTIRVVGRPGGVGYRREESHEVVDASGCLVAHPTLRELLGVLDVRPGTEVSLRCSVATGERTAVWDGPLDAVGGLPGDVGIGAGAHLSETVHHAATARDPSEEAAVTSLRVSADSFFQSGPLAAGLLVDAVARAAPELAGAETVVDLYGGVGLFAASVAPRVARIVLVESSRSAVSDARSNLSDRERVSVVRADVGRWDPRRSGVRDPEVIIADPPRAGLGRRAADVVAATGATTVVLVSCDPVAAARDAVLLAERGYRHERAEVLDLFPWTHHVETVTRYARVAGGRSGPGAR